MCNFFSFVEQSCAHRYYFNWEQRKKRLRTPSGQLIDSYDSHSEICAYYDLDVDKVNKYEFNPISKVLKVDQLNTKNHSKSAEKWANKLDFKTIVEPLIIKPIIDVEKDPARVTEREIKLLRNWASIRDSVYDSVYDSVRTSIIDSVGASVWDSVWNPIRISVWASVRTSVWDSVWDSVWGYLSSFFRIKKWEGFENLPDYENPFQSAVDLIENGLIPSFDGEMWQLHTINSSKIVYKEGK